MGHVPAMRANRTRRSYLFTKGLLYSLLVRFESSTSSITGRTTVHAKDNSHVRCATESLDLSGYCSPSART
eukprot:4279936-Pyramimonas_sp.AAC.1